MIISNVLPKHPNVQYLVMQCPVKRFVTRLFWHVLTKTRVRGRV